jgi:hypothetical protein
MEKFKELELCIASQCSEMIYEAMQDDPFYKMIREIHSKKYSIDKSILNRFNEMYEKKFNEWVNIISSFEFDSIYGN